MPEYSSTTITPADGVKTPAMNGSTSGNYTLSALRDFILASKGQANGLASLDANGKLPSSQLPDLADDVIVVASYATLPATGTAGKIYITADNNKMFRWDPDLETPDYVELSVDLSAYATKAELAAEESARESADSDLLSAIDANSNRISNLEENLDPTGAYKTVNYRGTNDVPTNKAKYALVESIVGKSRAWNQLMQGGDFTSASVFSLSYCSLSVQNHIGTITLNERVISARIRKIDDIQLTEGHKVLLSIKVNPSKTTNCAFYVGGNWTENISVTANTWQTINIITTIGNSGYECGFGFDRSNDLAVNDTVQVKEWFVRDLTLIFPEGVPATVAEAVALCPSILEYDAYGYSLPSTTVSGVKSIGVNLFNKANAELGYKYNASTGAKESSTGAMVTGLIEVRAGATIYTKRADVSPGNYSFVCWYDDNGTFIGRSDASTIDTREVQLPLNAKYVALTMYQSGTATHTVTSDDLELITINYSDNNINGTVYPYMEDTLTLPSSVTLRSAGTVADTDELNVEVLVDGQKVNKRRQTVNVGQTSFNGTENWIDHSTYCSLPIDGMTGDITWQNLISSHFANEYLDFNISGAIFNIRYMDAFSSGLASFKAWLASQMSAGTPFTINYPLRYPVETLLDPIENNTILTEGGGTINTIQTQTPVIDNSMDVGYLAL